MTSVEGGEGELNLRPLLVKAKLISRFDEWSLARHVVQLLISTYEGEEK